MFYAGALGTVINAGVRVCARWYFTFNRAECTKPATIEGIVYVEFSRDDPVRHRHIEGYCNKVPKGEVRVGFWVGTCEVYKVGYPKIGWKSTSRIVIEEVPPPQA